MVFVKAKNDRGMAAKWILGNKKKDGAKKTPPETKRSENTRKI